MVLPAANGIDWAHLSFDDDPALLVILDVSDGVFLIDPFALLLSDGTEGN